jgi:glycosyltransferase involved in cell wall biosynthesis
MQCDWLIELRPPTTMRRTRHADAILGVSDYISDGIRNKFPQLADRCYTLYNGSSECALRSDAASHITPTTLVRSPKDRIILFVGRITPEKGVHVLIQAMKSVVESCPDCVLLIVGAFAMNPPSPARSTSRDHKDEFEKLKADYKSYLTHLAGPIESRVRFVGMIPHNELGEWYDASDIFVHPSLWNEPFGMILTEAMTCGRPVISTRVGGIPEIVVHGETGLLVEPNDSNALSEAMIRILQDEELATSMGQQGKQRAEREFSWDLTAQGLVKILSAGAPAEA